MAPWNLIGAVAAAGGSCVLVGTPLSKGDADARREARGARNANVAGRRPTYVPLCDLAAAPSAPPPLAAELPGAGGGPHWQCGFCADAAMTDDVRQRSMEQRCTRCRATTPVDALGGVALDVLAHILTAQPAHLAQRKSTT